jgi:hypothetical protein
MEARIRERVELSNAGVVASLKEEGNRIACNLRIGSHQHAEILSKGHLIAETMEQVLDQGRILLTELRLIQAELKINGESTKKIAQATENNKAISQSTKEIVLTLTTTAEMNWITIGVGIGFILTLIATHLSWWMALLMFALAIGLLQALARSTLKAIRDMAVTMKPSDPKK